jgi:hypothetical protein
MNSNRPSSKLKVISFKTSGDWTIDEWSSFLDSVSIIYNIFFSVRLAKQFNKKIDKFKVKTLPKLTAREIYKNIGDYVDREAKLRIDKVMIASPGIFSFIGDAETIKLLITTLTTVTTIVTLSEIKKGKQLDNHKKLEEVKSTQLSNMQTLIAVFKDNGFSSEEIREFIKDTLGAMKRIEKVGADGKRLNLVKHIKAAIGSVKQRRSMKE